MEQLHKNILEDLRISIVDDLQVDNVIKHLKTEYILTEQDVEYIRAGSSDEGKAHRLLDILPGRGSSAFHIFHQSLKHHYYWLSEKMDKMLKSHSDTSEHYQRINIPPISPLTVTREEKVKQLRECLKKMKFKECLVIHGMKGFGKACLVASTLQDQTLLENTFKNQVYWLKFGFPRSNGSDEILTQLNNLSYQINHNIPTQPSSCKESWKSSLQSTINVHFKKNCHSEALLVLEDVHNKEIIDAFNFPCKILVITNDLNVLSGRRPTVIEMNDGFTERETLGLFARVLNTQIDKLPAQAKLIHHECKGMPLLIAMLGAQFEAFKHDMNRKSDRWKYYLRCLKEKNTENLVLKEFLEKQKVTFKMCITPLESDMKRRYESLAIFSQDVNIMPKTLQILWGDDQVYHVEDLMLDFCHKSLAAKQWNDDMKSYIYGVHDLLLSYLRETIDPENLRQMHETFVENCRKHGGGDFSTLPEDNYIYLYIGHHLEQAQLYEEFPRLYLDLNFLQAKIKHAGLSDLLIDLHKYRQYITKNNDAQLVSNVDDLEQFLRHNTNILAKQRSKDCLDLVQIALNFSEDSYVSKMARKLATKRSKDEKKCYLSLERKKRPLDSSLVSDELAMSGSITVAHFTDDADEILIGNDNGEVFLWNCAERCKKTVFHGHHKGDAIKKIVLSEKPGYFMTLSNNGVVKLFSYSEDNRLLEPKSPIVQQNNWRNMFQGRSVDDSLLTITIDNEVISDVMFGQNEETVVTCTNQGTLQIRAFDGKILLKDHRQECCLGNITFTNNYNLLHVLNTNIGVFIIYLFRKDHYDYVSQFNLQQGKVQVLFVKERSDIEGSGNLMIVTEKSVFVMKYFFPEGSCANLTNYQPYNFETRKRITIDDSDSKVFTCATLTHDDVYLILADSDGRVTVWFASECYDALKVFKVRVSCLDTYHVSEGRHLICASEGQVVHKWNLDQRETSENAKLAFNVIMKPSGEHEIIAQETCSNTIEVVSGNKVLYQSPQIDGKLEKLRLCKDGDQVVYLTNKMSVVHVECKSGKSTTVLQISRTHDFVTTMELDNCTVIICREIVDNTHNLKIWFDDNTTYILRDLGHVVNIHRVNDSFFVVVSRDCLVQWYNIEKKNKRQIVHKFNCNTKTRSTTDEIKVLSSCLSPDNRLLAITYENKELSIFQVEDVAINEIWTRAFQMPTAIKFTCAEFSHNGRYLAVGMDNGDVVIVSTEDRLENTTLTFHKTSINQLHWAASNVGVPLLLSVSHEEMALWNISLLNFRRSLSIRPSRMGPSRSVSTSSSISSSPRSSLLLQQNDDNNDLFNLAVGNLNLSGPKVTSYWKSKVGKDPNKPELVALVPIPGTTKVYVSEDFTKYIMVDENGSMNKYKLIDFS